MGWQNTTAFREALQAGNRARSELVVAHLPLVNSIVNKYVGTARAKGIDVVDLVQEGSLGLMRAAERFEVGRGARFSTYAYMHVKSVVLKFLSEHRHGMRVSAGFRQQVAAVHRVRDGLHQAMGREPTLQEVADAMSAVAQEVAARKGVAGVKVARVTVERVARLLALEASLQVVSTAQPTTMPSLSGDSAPLDVGGTLSALNDGQADSRSPEEFVDAQFVPQILESALAGLSERQAQIVRMRYGISSGRDEGERSGDTERPTRAQAAAVRRAAARRQQRGMGEQSDASLTKAVGLGRGLGRKRAFAMTQAEVASELGITQESVSILERKALNHLREALRRGTEVGEALRENASLRRFVPRDEVDTVGDDIILWPQSPLSKRKAPKKRDQAAAAEFGAPRRLIGLQSTDPELGADADRSEEDGTGDAETVPRRLIGGGGDSASESGSESDSTEADAVVADGIAWPVLPPVPASAADYGDRVGLLGTGGKNKAFIERAQRRTGGDTPMPQKPVEEKGEEEAGAIDLLDDLLDGQAKARRLHRLIMLAKAKHEANREAAQHKPPRVKRRPTSEKKPRASPAGPAAVTPAKSRASAGTRTGRATARALAMTMSMNSTAVGG